MNSWKQTILIAVIMGVLAAGLVWYLQSFERERLRIDWQSFLDNWHTQTGGQPDA